MTAMAFPKSNLILVGIAAAIATSTVHAGEAPTASASHARCVGTDAAGERAPVPADPYPLMAAGWGPELGGGVMASRWAEDWAGMDDAPRLKAIPLHGDASLTFSAEARLRQVSGETASGTNTRQLQFRGIVGADLRLDPHVRVYAEVGAGQVDRDRDSTAANMQNRVSLQQLFVDARGQGDGMLVGAMLGRQEFADGPKQLLSLGDGANLRRTWNGIRAYAHARRYRIGAFELRGTEPGAGGFDDSVQTRTILRGINASVIVSRGEGPNTYLDPFWFHTEIPSFQLGGESGPDRRDTLGLRLWGRKGATRWDWTLARQQGRTLDGRDIDAWGAFAVQSVSLSERGWKPRLTSHIDIASGGGTRSAGVLRNFHPLYASSNYLGEGRFLALSNLVFVAPGISMAPNDRTSFSFEYGFARRLDARDAVYAGGMRAYAGTEDVPGRNIGALARFSGTWSASRNLSFNANIEHLAAGSVLQSADFHSATYLQLDLTYRY